MKEREKAILILSCVWGWVLIMILLKQLTFGWLEHISSAKVPALSSVKAYDSPLRISVSLGTEKESDADAPNQQVNALHVQKQSIVKKNRASFLLCTKWSRGKIKIQI